MKTSFWILLILTTVLIPCHAQDSAEQTVRGVLASFDNRSISLKDRGKFVISPNSSDKIAQTLEIAVVGQKISLALSGSVVVDAILDNPGFEVDLTFYERIDIGQGFIVKFKEGAQFAVNPKKLDSVSKNLFFVQKNIRVRVTLLDRKIVGLKVKDVSMPPPRLSLSPALRAQINRVKVGSTITINESYSGVVNLIDDQSFTYQPVDENGKDKGSEKWFAFGLIEELTIAGAKIKGTDVGKTPTNPENPDKTGTKDSISALDLVIGDTIGVGLKKGILESLTKQKISLRVWDRDQFSESVEFERSVVESKVRRTRLSADRRYKLEAGEIRVVSQRLKDSSRDIFEFQLRITHNLEGSILVNTELQAFTNPSKQSGAVGEKYGLPPIFAGEVFTWKNSVKVSAANAELVLVLNSNSLAELKSPEAVLAIGLRLVNPEPGDRLLRTYNAVIDNQDPNLLAMVIAQLMLPDVAPAVKKQAFGAFQRAGDQVPKLLVDILIQDGTKLEYVVPDTVGRAIRKPIEMPVSEYQLAALKLLANYDGRIPPEQVNQIMRLSERYEGTQDSEVYLLVVKRHIDSLARAVVGIAADPKPDEEMFKLGTDILRSQGQRALKPLLDLLRERGLDKQASAIADQLGSQKPQALVQLAIEQVVTIQRKRALKLMQQELGSIFKAMERAKAIKEDLDAVQEWSTILARHKKLPQDKIFVIELLPEILLNYGVRLAKVKRRGLAFAQFQAALSLLSENRDNRRMTKHQRALRKNTGRILLESLNEELAGVNIRRGPNFGYETLRVLDIGEVRTIVADEKRVNGWFPVFDGKVVGWLPPQTVRLTKSGNSVTITSSSLPIDKLQSLLNDGRKFAPSRTALINKIQAEIYSREIEGFFISSDHDKVLERIAELEEIAPSHPAISKKWLAWLMVYWIYPALFGSVIFGAVVFWFVHLLLGRQKRMKIENADYTYYGKDRSEVERTFE